jgi:recombination protein RecA
MTVPAHAQRFIETVNGKYKLDVCGIGTGKTVAKNMPRISTGSLSLDLATGGGLPFEKISLIVGEYSTGKSVIAMQTMANIVNYDHRTKLHYENFKGTPKESQFNRGTALYVDSEFAFDEAWAESMGIDTSQHVICRPDYGEQGVDIISNAIYENAFDLIIVDSLSQLTPSKEMEDSAEDKQVAEQARMLNKATKKWLSTLITLHQKGQKGPCVILLNQFRMKIGIIFGDPRTIPGGKNQEFVASILIYTHGQKYADTKDEEEVEKGSVLLKGNIHKNKTYVPRQGYAFHLGLANEKKGRIDNTKVLVQEAKKHKLIKKEGGSWAYQTKKWPTDKAIEQELAVSVGLQRMLWKEIVRLSCGSTMI